MPVRREVAAILMLAVLAASSGWAQGAGSVRPPAAPPAPTPFASEPILAEATAGALMAFGISLGMARVGATVLGPRGGEDPGLAGGIVGFAAGLVLGSSLGVHLVARRYGLPARYEEAVAGALAGVLLLPALPIDLDRAGAWLAIYAVPTATAVLASSPGSWSRSARPAVRALRDGIGVGVEVGF